MKFLSRSVLAGGVALAVLLTGAAGEAAPAPGDQAPEAHFTTLGGKTLSLADFRSHKLMLWLFSTWCPSCQAGLQALAEQRAALGKGKLRLVVLQNYRNGGYGGPSMNALIERYAANVKGAANWTFGAATAELQSRYNPKSYPDVYYLIDAHGKVRYVGSAPAASLDRILKFAAQESAE